MLIIEIDFCNINLMIEKVIVVIPKIEIGIDDSRRRFGFETETETEIRLWLWKLVLVGYCTAYKYMSVIITMGRGFGL